MKIYDCFMYFDEDTVLDLRLNYLNKFVDQFIIVESKFTHRGGQKELLFDIDKYSKFKDKITYLTVDQEPDDLHTINADDDENTLSKKYILNAAKRENYQRNYILKGIEKADLNDLILISDLDEIPNLEKIDFNNLKSKFIFFQQKMFYYKFNLYLPSVIWTGSKGCKKKNLISPQWLRNIKDKSYPLWRVDIFFSNNKYHDINIIKEGGWHFSYLKTPEDIEKKLKAYLHHREYDINPVGIEKIKKMINEKKTIYNLKVDMRANKFDGGNELKKIDLNLLPSYISNNKNKFSDWIED